MEVLAECNHPLVIVTKNYLVTRDTDHLSKLAKIGAVKVAISITSLEESLIHKMEPRTSRPKKRLKAVRELSQAGIPVHINIAPVIPGLTDGEIVPILEAAAEAGAESVSYTILRLPYGVKDLFIKWLEDHAPNRKSKVINKIKSVKDGHLNRSEFGKRFKGEGTYAEQIKDVMKIHAKRLGLNKTFQKINRSSFKRPQYGQLNIFN